MDEKFGGHWNVIVGDGFQVSHSKPINTSSAQIYASFFQEISGKLILRIFVNNSFVYSLLYFVYRLIVPIYCILFTG